MSTHSTLSIVATPIQNAPVSMSSREIAELTGKEHKNVLRVIRDLISGEILDAQIEPLKFKYRNQLFDYYELNKRDSLVVVARLSPEFTAKIVDRWQELEAQINPTIVLPNFEDPAEAAIAWATQFKEKQTLALVNKEQQDEINDLRNFFKEGMSIPQFCKMLNGVNVQLVNQYCHARNWLYNEGKSNQRWRVSAYARDRYLTEHQHKVSVHGGEDFIKFQPVLLRHGADRLFTLYRQAKLPMKANWDGQFTHEELISWAS